jgi:hypothetical protein
VSAEVRMWEADSAEGGSGTVGLARTPAGYAITTMDQHMRGVTVRMTATEAARILTGMLQFVNGGEE